jgi:phosphonate transport system substrate-binding protein
MRTLCHVLLRCYAVIAFCTAGILPVCAAPAATNSITIATYAYPGLDRQRALLPIKQQLETLYQVDVTTVIFDSPTTLAQAASLRQVDLIVPNLAAYLQLKLSSNAMLDIAVPSANMDVAQQYTSSIVVPNNSHLTSVAMLIEQLDNVTLAMVWPDSASGGLIASAHLLDTYNISRAKLTSVTSYLGTHQKVLAGVIAAEFQAGVLATDILRQYHAEKPDLKVAPVVEIWRSAALPFGPVVCLTAGQIDCKAFRQHVLKNEDVANAILDGLKLGWPEFLSSASLEPVDDAAYSVLLQALK